MALDWGALLTSLIEGIGDVITAFITAISTNADDIANLLIFGVITGAVVNFGSKAFSGIGDALKGIFS